MNITYCTSTGLQNPYIVTVLDKVIWSVDIDLDNSVVKAPD